MQEPEPGGVKGRRRSGGEDHPGGRRIYEEAAGISIDGSKDAGQINIKEKACSILRIEGVFFSNSNVNNNIGLPVDRNGLKNQGNAHIMIIVRV